MISKQSVRQVVIGLALVLFVLGYLLVVRAGVSDVKHLFGFLVASYLVVWGGYSLLSSLSKGGDPNSIRSHDIALNWF